jgi:hypothetical protein
LKWRENVALVLRELSLLSSNSAVVIVVDMGSREFFWGPPDGKTVLLRNFMELIYPGLLRVRLEGQKVAIQVPNREDEFKEELSA